MSRDAVVVGINTYANSGMNLTAPAQDAEAIAKLLELHGDFKVKRLPAVKDKENQTIRVGQKSKVTLNELKQAIAQLFKPEGKHIPDTALLYFSGHGLRDNLGIQQGFLATSDINPDLGNWGLSLQWLRQLLQESEVKQQIIILDCCYSGELLNFDDANPGNSGKVRDRCFIAASREFEVAYEGIGSNHSVLTQALLQGLDPTHTNSGDWVTNYSVIESIRQHLPKFPQRPIFANAGEWINLVRTQTVPNNSSAIVADENSTTVPNNSSAIVADENSTTVPNNPSAIVSSDICPYRGLLAFDCRAEDAQYFFGREALTDELLNNVRVSNFLAVLGASGSGKSSVVRAGLLYQLTLGQRLSGSENWEIKIIRPGEHPLKALALAFVDKELSTIDQASQLDKAENLLAQGSVGLRRLIEVSHRPVVLVVDQFEEVFTLCRDKEERQKFFECLLRAVETFHGTSLQIGTSLHIILTMRADFFGKCAEYGELAQRIQANLVTVTPMTREELRQAIVEPAKRVNLELEPELVQQMLKDVENAPGSLPLLQYTLMELWKQRTDNCLRLSNYSQQGGVMGTLQKRATEVYESFSQTQQAAVQHIFLALTQLGEGTEDTRRRVRKEDLVNRNYSEQLIDDVVQRLADERLIVTQEESNSQPQSQIPKSKSVVVDVAHEALIRHWTLLRKWVDGNREKLRQKRKIEAAAQEWRDRGKGKDYLWRGKPLQEAVAFKKVQQGSLTLSNLAGEFIQASQKQKVRSWLKTSSLLTIPLLVVFVGVVPYLREQSYKQALDTIKNPSQEGTKEALELLTEGCWERQWIPDNVATVLFGKCYDLNRFNLNRFNLRGADLSFADLSFADLSSANLFGAKLSGADLSFADLSDANLSRAYLSDADLTGAKLSRANLNDANLSLAYLSGANLSRANLNDANLSNANLSRANLIDADLIGADLSLADLSGANLSRANLSRANLSNAYLSDADLKKAVYTKETKLPQNFDPVKQQMLLIAPGANLRGADLSGLNLRVLTLKILTSVVLTSLVLTFAMLKTLLLSKLNLRRIGRKRNMMRSFARS